VSVQKAHVRLSKFDSIPISSCVQWCPREVAVVPPLPSPAPKRKANPDLQTQFEDLLSAVWEAEEEWKLDDRIDLAVRLGSRKKKAA